MENKLSVARWLLCEVYGPHCKLTLILPFPCFQYSVDETRAHARNLMDCPQNHSHIRKRERRKSGGKPTPLPPPKLPCSIPSPPTPPPLPSLLVSMEISMRLCTNKSRRDKSGAVITFSSVSLLQIRWTNPGDEHREEL